MFLTNATADADGKLDKPLDATVRNLGRLPEYMMKAALLEAVAANPVSSAAVTKIWVDKERSWASNCSCSAMPSPPAWISGFWTNEPSSWTCRLEGRRQIIQSC